MECWIAHGWADDGVFIVRDDSIVKGALVVPLLEDTLVGDGFGGEETEGFLLQYWGVALGALVDAVLNNFEDHNA